MTDQRVCVVGLGYIGLPTSALLANSHYMVHGVDVMPHVVQTINEGNIHIIEPDLDTHVRAAVNSGRLKASLTPAESEVFIIAVPTPFHEGYVPNVDYVRKATEAIATFVRSGNLIILESTSPVGTTELVRDTLAASGVDTASLFIAYCPERVLPGHVMRELVENDRIVGGLNKESTERVAAFYQTFVRGEVLMTDARTAEMAKLTENASRDVSIAFANELSMICDRVGIDVWELIALANKHPRVNILRPGPGVGGHCIAVDPWFIVHQAPEEAKIIRQAREVNTYKTLWVQEKIKNAILTFTNEHGREPKVALMGLAFKPDIDDLRESPSLEIAHLAQNWPGADVRCVEPHVDEAKGIKPLIRIDQAYGEADIIVFLVAHRQFKQTPPPEGRIILDFCGISR